MADYTAGSFSDLFNTPEGRRLWDFLNSHDNLVRMETATYLQRPALEPVSPFLQAEFGDWIAEDRSKQMAGNMVKQIMAGRGYEVERKGVKIRNRADIFTTAARYCRHGAAPLR
jgi:hypothetical protein